MTLSLHLGFDIGGLFLTYFVEGQNPPHLREPELHEPEVGAGDAAHHPLRRVEGDAEVASRGRVSASVSGLSSWMKPVRT